MIPIKTFVIALVLLPNSIYQHLIQETWRSESGPLRIFQIKIPYLE